MVSVKRPSVADACAATPFLFHPVTSVTWLPGLAVPWMVRVLFCWSTMLLVKWVGSVTRLQAVCPTNSSPQSSVSDSLFIL